jgi:hypothetical protein
MMLKLIAICITVLYISSNFDYSKHLFPHNILDHCLSTKYNMTSIYVDLSSLILTIISPLKALRSIHYIGDSDQSIYINVVAGATLMILPPLCKITPSC